MTKPHLVTFTEEILNRKLHFLSSIIILLGASWNLILLNEVSEI